MSPMANSDFSGVARGGRFSALDVFDGLVAIALVPIRLRAVTRPSWTIRLRERSSGSTSPRFLAPQAQQRHLVVGVCSERAVIKNLPIGKTKPISLGFYNGSLEATINSRANSPGRASNSSTKKLRRRGRTATQAYAIEGR